MSDTLRMKTTPNASKQQQVLIPPILRSIIHKEGKSRHVNTCLTNIEQAKQNELRSYMALCKIRLNGLMSP